MAVNTHLLQYCSHTVMWDIVKSQYNGKRISVERELELWLLPLLIRKETIFGNLQ